MKIVFALMVAGLIIIQPAHAEHKIKINLNPQHGSPAYNVFSVFAPDAPDMAHLRNDVIAVFHGFRSAIPNGTYKRVRKAFLKTHTVIGINYDPLDIGRTLEFLNAVEKKWLRGRSVVVLGTSAGGYWANYFGHHIGAKKIVLLNPITNPITQLRKYVGVPSKNKRRIQKFFVKAESLKAYEGFKDIKQTTIPRLVILTADDKTLNYRKAINFYAGNKNTKVIVYPTGGHTLNLRKHKARAAIIRFVNGG
jgi:predicted esterase YcpF (UPF0227 family)